MLIINDRNLLNRLFEKTIVDQLSKVEPSNREVKTSHDTKRERRKESQSQYPLDNDHRNRMLVDSLLSLYPTNFKVFGSINSFPLIQVLENHILNEYSIFKVK